MVPFNIPYISGDEQALVEDAIRRKNLSGEGYYTKACQERLADFTGASRVLLTPSCTHALELSALLLNLQAGDEVIMASFTFVSTANAFVLRGATPVFVDIRPDTMNIDERLIEKAINSKTKAIVVMHYAGVACEMDTIMALADKYGLIVIEDAAQCVDTYYKGRHLGTIGHFGTFSFHSTKNIHCGEGGALLINEAKFIEAAEVIREKGTNRNQFLRGEVDKYSWVNIGSSILMGELNAAFLYAQLDKIKEVSTQRLALWEQYRQGLTNLPPEIQVPIIPENCQHNGHMFYLKCKDIRERQLLIDHFKQGGITASFHYVPLHTAPAGQRFGRFDGDDHFTTKESERLLRLPLYFDLQALEQICDQAINFFAIHESKSS